MEAGLSWCCGWWESCDRLEENEHSAVTPEPKSGRTRPTLQHSTQIYERLEANLDFIMLEQP